jgi:long-subunit acyl-CoA synthetase (AMP-forming)
MRPGYVGVPMPGVQVRISPEGEILIKSPGRMVGYYKQPELTPRASPKTASSAPATWASSAPTAC